MTYTNSPTIRHDIFIAGDLARAKQICREYCFETGLCVTVEAVDYIYTGGEESGVRVGIINYPRFPAELPYLANKADQLAHRLLEGLCQHSFSIVGPRETEWFTRREENAVSDMTNNRKTNDCN
jgi:hypothetical protein